MAHAFEAGQREKVREDGQLEDGVNQDRGRTGTIDHVVDSSPELTFYCVAFRGEWDRGYIREAALALAVEDAGP